MNTPNPYAPPELIEEPLDAIIIDNSTLEPSPPVLKTLAGVALSIGLTIGADPIAKDLPSRLGLLAAAVATIGYSASLSDKKRPSAA